MRILGEAFQKSNPDIRVDVMPTIGSSGGIKAVMAGRLDIGLSGRPVSAGERARVTLQSIGDGVISTDPEDRVLIVNRMAERITGWTQAEAAGKPIGEIFRPEGDVLVDRSGVSRKIEVEKSPVLDESGRPVGTVFVLRDVTEKERVESAMATRRSWSRSASLPGGSRTRSATPSPRSTSAFRASSVSATDPRGSSPKRRKRSD